MLTLSAASLLRWFRLRSCRRGEPRPPVGAGAAATARKSRGRNLAASPPSSLLRWFRPPSCQSKAAPCAGLGGHPANRAPSHGRNLLTLAVCFCLQGCALVFQRGGDTLTAPADFDSHPVCVRPGHSPRAFPAGCPTGWSPAPAAPEAPEAR